MTRRLVQIDSTEERLMKQIQAWLHQYGQLERPLKAKDFMMSMLVDDYARIAAWAELALRQYVITKRHAIDGAMTEIKPRNRLAELEGGCE